MKTSLRERLWPFAALALLASGALSLSRHGDLDQLGQVPPFLAGLALMGAGYLAALRAPSFPAGVFWGAAIGLRLLLVVTMHPGRDIYRYIWEGRALAAHANPYVTEPDSPELRGLRDGLWERVEFRDASTIYPPLAEAAFALTARAGGRVIGFKALFALADLLLCALLVRRFGRKAALAYAWNPLVLYVFSGGGHYDSLFLLPLAAAWLLLEKNAAAFRSAGAWLGSAIAIKWVALPLLGWVSWRAWRTKGWGQAAATLGLGLAPVAVTWLGICLSTGHWTLDLAPWSFVRSERSAEFLPAVVAQIFPSTTYRNELFVLPLIVAWIVIILKSRRFERAAEGMFFALFLLTPMVHAWYFTWLLPFAVLTRNPGSIALTLSGLAYFWVYHRVQQPGGDWTFTWPERLFMWLPFILGFLWWQRRRTLRQGPLPCADQNDSLPHAQSAAAGGSENAPGPGDR